jgi:NAD(P)-dependent dehydrogenase (short-subunit alcohol dehydrogenase family)
MLVLAGLGVRRLRNAGGTPLVLSALSRRAMTARARMRHTGMSDLSTQTTIVVGASRGLGRGIATAFAEAGVPVVAVARGAAEYPAGVRAEIADAGDAAATARLVDRHDPQVIVIAAGATPHMRPLQQQTWETFSLHWQTDVRIAFHWLREALLKPLRPGSRVLVVSSGAALNPNGSPLSGGYAGAKATQRFITGYAQDEANRAGLGITFTTVMPQFAPETGVGELAVQAYAAQAGLSVDAFLETQPFELLTPEVAGAAVVELVRADPADLGPAYRLNGAGLQKLS